MKIIKLTKELFDEDIDKLGGKFMDESNYDTLIEEECKVLKPDGSPLIVFRKKCLPADLCQIAYKSLREAAKATDNRGYAAGLPPEEGIPGLIKVGKSRVRRVKKDGTLSNTVETMSSKIAYVRRAGMQEDDPMLLERSRKVESGVVGYYNREARFPYCRLTAFGLDKPEKFLAAMPYVKAVDAIFKEEMPDRYSAQMGMVQKTSSDFVIHSTAFTTITVNRNFQTALHKDVGDLKEGFGVMTALRAGTFHGCYLCFPKFRVAVDMRNQDVLLADVHEWHGNTAIVGIKGAYERISTVMYYRAKIIECGTALEEKKRAEGRKRKGTGSIA